MPSHISNYNTNYEQDFKHLIVLLLILNALYYFNDNLSENVNFNMYYY